MHIKLDHILAGHVCVMNTPFQTAFNTQNFLVRAIYSNFQTNSIKIDNFYMNFF